MYAYVPAHARRCSVVQPSAAWGQAAYKGRGVHLLASVATGEGGLEQAGLATGWGLEARLAVAQLGGDAA